YSWKRTLSNQDSPNIGFFEPIENAKEISSGTMKPDKLGVYAKDKNTLVINLSTPSPYFTSMLINTAFFPQKQEVVEKEGDRYGTNSDSMIYNGPYTLNSLKNTGISEKWKLKKNTKYWDSKSIRMNEIDMNVIKDVGTGVSLFEAEKLDDVPLSGEYAKQNIKNDNFVSEVSDSALLLEVNHGNSKLNNIHLRRAISNAIDRKNLVDNVVANGSVPLTSILTDNLKVSKEVTAGNYDLDRARKELEIAKNELKQNNFTFDILTNDQDLGVKASEFIQGQLNRLEGIKVNIVPVPATVQFDRLSKKEFDLSISGVAADYPDPFSIGVHGT
ncbi:peptide ABC transporter substrate-binding protein, partial [Enterococcus faecalis]|uniref:peptide ABC transporter substrate-binding protein n=1 Tax=Enterococcus faecalis TaxID=1351 RepID=UPI0018E71034